MRDALLTYLLLPKHPFPGYGHSVPRCPVITLSTGGSSGLKPARCIKRRPLPCTSQSAMRQRVWGPADHRPQVSLALPAGRVIVYTSVTAACPY